jgi:DNA modification methylase
LGQVAKNQAGGDWGLEESDEMIDWLNKCHFGDCLDVLRGMPDGIVNTCVTSPPYFGLRDYGHFGQIGLEATPDEFVSKLVEVFREVRRVLRDDGTLWVNMGDSYASKLNGPAGTGGHKGEAPHVAVRTAHARRSSSIPAGLKHKDLMGVPWMLAFALRADGWYLRQDIIWAKPNPMPESVTDRCTKSHEYIFLPSKSPSYYCDMVAIKEQAVADHAPGNHTHKGATAYEQEDGEHHRTKFGLVAYAQRQRSARESFKRDGSKRAEVMPGQSVGTHRNERKDSDWPLDTRNKRSVWTVSTKPYKGAHFATFPTDLIEPCILAGAPAGGVVLDVFGGSGTTAQVAQALGRNWILIELNEAYAPLIEDRIRQPSFAFEEAI